MSRCLLIDLAGVIRVWDPLQIVTIEQRYALPGGSIVAAAFGNDSLLHDAVTGRVTDEQWRHDVACRLQLICGAVAHAVVAQWSASPGNVDADVASVLASARLAGWRIALLTNATTRLPTDLRALDLHDAFDAIVNSSDLGVRKPDPRAYRAACRRMGVEPESCVFVDDTAENVAAAAGMGIDAHLHRGATHLADLLGVTAPSTCR